MKNSLALSLAICVTACAPSSGDAQTRSALVNEVGGFASGTTGGQGQQHYVVTTRADTGQPGSLRYALERGNAWITFSPDLFTTLNARERTRDAVIELDRPVYIRRGNLTIDGRAGFDGDLGRRVVIRRHFDWGETKAGGSNGQCLMRNNRGGESLFRIEDARNIIITHIAFRQTVSGRRPQGVTETDCMGDVIEIYNPQNRQASVEGYDNIWINRSEFVGCMDGCIDITQPTDDRVADITISNNRFANSAKVFLWGNHAPNKRPEFDWKLRVSLYGNHFLSSARRMPLVQGAEAHVFNNLFENWGASVVDVRNPARVTVENNLFLAGNRKRDALLVFDRTQGRAPAQIAEGSNRYAGGVHDVRTVRIDRNHPSYRAGVRGVRLLDLTAARTVSDIRRNAGWAPAPSDVR